MCRKSYLYLYDFSAYLHMCPSQSVGTDRGRFWDQPVLCIFHPEGHVSQKTPPSLRHGVLCHFGPFSARVQLLRREHAGSVQPTDLALSMLNRWSSFVTYFSCDNHSNFFVRSQTLCIPRICLAGPISFIEKDLLKAFFIIPILIRFHPTINMSSMYMRRIRKFLPSNFFTNTLSWRFSSIGGNQAKRAKEQCATLQMYMMYL